MTKPMATTKCGVMVIRKGKPDVDVVAPNELVAAALAAKRSDVAVTGVVFGDRVYTIERTGYIESHVVCFDPKGNQIEDLGFWIGARFEDLIAKCAEHAGVSLTSDAQADVVDESDAG